MALATAAVFTNRPAAEIARARLESAGISASVHSDDAGGLFPDLSWRGVRVMVAEADLAAAAAVLEEPPDPAFN
ncbi:MAG: putative signal transducing protein [Actinomycetota bacterium]